MFSISFRKQRYKKEENNLLTLIIKMWILFAHVITTSTARASSVSPSSYTNTIFNQSARVLSAVINMIKIESNSDDIIFNYSHRFWELVLLKMYMLLSIRNVRFSKSALFHHVYYRCFIFVIKLRWPKNKSLYKVRFMLYQEFKIAWSIITHILT